MARVHVLGFGNIYQGDDGFGPKVCEALAREALPDDVRVYDVGTAGLHALSLLEGCDRAILVDAMASLGEPGRLHRLLPDDARVPGDPLSSHGLGLAHLLRVLPLTLDPVPEVLLLCAEAEDIQSFSPTLTPALRDAVSRAVSLLRDEVRS